MESTAPKPPRITNQLIGESLLGLFSLEKGVFHTIWNLIRRPGNMLYNYLFEDRTKDIKPFKFLVFTTALAVIISVRFSNMEADFLRGMNEGIEMSAAGKDIPEEKLLKMRERGEEYRVFVHKVLNEYMNLLFLVAIPITSIFSYLFFKSKKYYYAEHLVINAYLQGFQNLLFIILFPLIYYYPNLVFIYFIIALAYACIAYVVVFKENWSNGIFKALGAQVCGMIVYYLLLLVFLVIALYVIVKG